MSITPPTNYVLSLPSNPQQVVYIERPGVECPSLPSMRNMQSTDCSNFTNVNSQCDYDCEKGFYNVGSQRQTCRMGYNSPGKGIYYGVEAEWEPQLPPKCEGRC